MHGRIDASSMGWRQNVALEKGLSAGSAVAGYSYLDRTISPRVPMGRNGKDPTWWATTELSSIELCVWASLLPLGPRMHMHGDEAGRPAGSFPGSLN